MKKNKFIFFILSMISYEVYSQACSGHSHNLQLGGISDIQKIITSISDQDCPDDNVDELIFLKEKYIDSYKMTPRIQKTVHGLNLHDHVAAITALEVILEDKPSPLINNAKECSTVVCILEKMTGSEKAAYQLLDIYQDSGYALSFKKISDKQNQYWNTNQIDKTHHAILNMPPEFKKLKGLSHLYVMHEKFSIDDYMRELGDRSGYESAGGLASLSWGSGQARGLIYFNPSVYGNNQNWVSDTIIHEIAHHYDYQALIASTGSSQAKLKGFYDLSGWKEIGGKWHIDKDAACFITEYAQTNPKEHFAETISHFMTQPIALKKKCPDYFDFAKDKIFNGYDPIQKNRWNEFEVALNHQAPNLIQCLKPELKSFIHFQQQVYYQNAGDTNSFSTAFTPTIDHECLLNVLKPIQAVLKQNENYCQMGGLKGLLETANYRLQSTLDFFLSENSLAAEENILNQQLIDCTNEKNLTMACLKDKTRQYLTQEFEKNSDIAAWFGENYMNKQLDVLLNKMELYGTNDVSEFTKQHETDLIIGCLDNLTNISLTQNKIHYHAGFYSGTTASILTPCQKGGGQKIAESEDSDVLRLLYNQDHISDKLDLIGSKVLLPYSKVTLACRQEVKCRTESLTKLIQSAPELKNMQNELVKIISEKYRN